MSIRRRITVLLAPLAALGLLGTGVIAAAPASAAVTPECSSIHRQINFQEASVPLQIGFQKVTFTFCYDRNGTVTSSSAVQDVDTTAGGTAEGYTIYPENIYPITATSGRRDVAWEVPARGRLCVVKIVPICGFWEDFSTQVHYYSPTFIGPTPNTYQGASFWARCTNSTCRFEFAGNT